MFQNFNSSVAQAPSVASGHLEEEEKEMKIFLRGHHHSSGPTVQDAPKIEHFTPEYHWHKRKYIPVKTALITASSAYKWLPLVLGNTLFYGPIPTMSRIPPVMRAVVVQKRGAVGVKEIPVPILDAYEILVKVMSVALNPADWKHVYNLPKPDTIIGCDFSGVVVELGASVKGPVQVGDHVAGFVQGSHWKDRGAFAEYLKTDWDLVWTIPEETFSHQEAASISTCLWTGVQAMYHPGRLAIPEPPAKVDPDKWFFVYGGSTSVGQYAIQLARISGFRVATVASPHNHAMLKELGAEVVFDYKQSGVVEEIKKATNDAIHYALDTHAADGSQLFTVRTLGPGPGAVTVILPPQEDAKNLRADVKVIYTLLYTALGREFSMGGDKTFVRSEEDRNHMSAFLPKLTQLVTEGKIRPNRIKLWEGGLEAVWDGMEYMRAGKVSGEKVVYNVADE